MTTKYISKSELEQEAENFLSQFSPSSLEEAKPLDIEYIIENDLNLNIIYRKLDIKNNLLGMIILNPMKIKCIDEETGEIYDESFDRNNILINSFLAEDDSQEHRLRFTLAHEVGHWYLHRQEAYIDDGQSSLFDMSYSKNRIDRYVDSKSTTKLLSKKIVTDEDRREWQANYFASCILMPRKTIIKEYEKCKKAKVLISVIGTIISRKYNVSPETTNYRLKDLIKNNNSNLTIEGW